ncbi:hypothetical protein GCM10027346_30120 [Hymenobacter seoulensis]
MKGLLSPSRICNAKADIAGFALTEGIAGAGGAVGIDMQEKYRGERTGGGMGSNRLASAKVITD